MDPEPEAPSGSGSEVAELALTQGTQITLDRLDAARRDVLVNRIHRGIVREVAADGLIHYALPGEQDVSIVNVPHPDGVNTISYSEQDFLKSIGKTGNREGTSNLQQLLMLHILDGKFPAQFCCRLGHDYGKLPSDVHQLLDSNYQNVKGKIGGLLHGEGKGKQAMPKKPSILDRFDWAFVAYCNQQRCNNQICGAISIIGKPKISTPPQGTAPQCTALKAIFIGKCQHSPTHVAPPWMHSSIAELFKQAVGKSNKPALQHEKISGFVSKHAPEAALSHNPRASTSVPAQQRLHDRDLIKEGFHSDEQTSLRYVQDATKADQASHAEKTGVKYVLPGIIQSESYNTEFALELYTEELISLYGIWRGSLQHRVVALPLLADLTGGLVRPYSHRKDKKAVLCTYYMVPNLANSIEGMSTQQRHGNWVVFLRASDLNDANSHHAAAARWLRSCSLVMYNNGNEVGRVKPLIIITDNDGALDKGMCMAFNSGMDIKAYTAQVEKELDGYWERLLSVIQQLPEWQAWLQNIVDTPTEINDFLFTQLCVKCQVPEEANWLTCDKRDGKECLDDLYPTQCREAVDAFRHRNPFDGIPPAQLRPVLRPVLLDGGTVLLLCHSHWIKQMFSCVIHSKSPAIKQLGNRRSFFQCVMGMLFGAITKGNKLRGPDKWDFAKWYVGACRWFLTTPSLPALGAAGVPVYPPTGKPFLEVRKPTQDDETPHWPLGRMEAVIQFNYCETLKGAQFKIRIPKSDDVSTMAHFHPKEGCGEEEGDLLDALERAEAAGEGEMEWAESYVHVEDGAEECGRGAYGDEQVYNPAYYAVQAGRDRRTVCPLAVYYDKEIRPHLVRWAPLLHPLFPAINHSTNRQLARFAEISQITTGMLENHNMQVKNNSEVASELPLRSDRFAKYQAQHQPAAAAAAVSTMAVAASRLNRKHHSTLKALTKHCGRISQTAIYLSEQQAAMVQQCVAALHDRGAAGDEEPRMQPEAESQFGTARQARRAAAVHLGNREHADSPPQAVKRDGCNFVAPSGQYGCGNSGKLAQGCSFCKKHCELRHLLHHHEPGFQKCTVSSHVAGAQSYLSGSKLLPTEFLGYFCKNALFFQQRDARGGIPIAPTPGVDPSAPPPVQQQPAVAIPRSGTVLPAPSWSKVLARGAAAGPMQPLQPLARFQVQQQATAAGPPLPGMPHALPALLPQHLPVPSAASAPSPYRDAVMAVGRGHVRPRHAFTPGVHMSPPAKRLNVPLAAHAAMVTSPTASRRVAAAGTGVPAATMAPPALQQLLPSPQRMLFQDPLQLQATVLGALSGMYGGILPVDQ